MTESKTIAEDITSLKDAPDAPHPLIYADGLSAVALGPFVSRFTVSVENYGTGQRVPMVTIAMPTNMLLQLGSQIVKSMTEKESQLKLKQAYEQHEQAIKLAGV